MNVKELIQKLQEYNPDALVDIVVHNRSQEFSICFGSSDGVTKEYCDSVSFYVDALCQNERAEATNG